MIDWHCHILPALDDGARSVDEALAMARRLAGAGFKAVCCTPHCIRGAYDTTPETVQAATIELQRRLESEGIDLELRMGMEYYLDELFLQERELLPLGDSDLVLVEAPSRAIGEIVEAGLRRVVAAGYTPLVAHPERSDIFAAEAVDLPETTQFQANLGSFTGFYGSRVKARASRFLSTGRYARIGSDGHNARGLSAILESWQTKFAADPSLRTLGGPAARAVGRNWGFPLFASVGRAK